MKLNLSIKQIADIVSGKINRDNASNTIDSIEIDSRTILHPKSSCFICLKGNKTDGHQFITELDEQKCALIIGEMDISTKNSTYIRVENALEALQKIAIHHRNQFDIPVIGITGSNGKTIVKEWLYELLKNEYQIARSPKSYNSQIGVALSILQIRKEHTLGIFEAGISKSGEMRSLEKMIQPSTGIFTGIGKAHESGFESQDTKLREKFHLFDNCKRVVCEDQFSPLTKCETHIWNRKDIEIRGNQSIIQLNGMEMVVEFTTQFPTNLMNTLLTASLFSKTYDQHISDLSSLSLRLETENGINSNKLINDAYSFDIDSLKIALNYQYQQYPSDKKILIASSPETNMESDFWTTLANYNLDEIILIGEKPVDKKVQCFASKTELIESEYLNQFQDSVILIKGYRKDHLEEIILELEEITHKTWLEIDLSALRKNISFFRSKQKMDGKLLVMVKASAYGGGLDRIGAILENESIDYLGVAYPEEGVQLRKSGVQLPILVMNSEKASFEKIIQYGLEPSIYSMRILEELIRFLIKKGIRNYPIHVKIETGMNRLGFLPSELKLLIEKLVSQPEVIVSSVFSHLSSSDDPGEIEWTKEQKATFDQSSAILQTGLSYPFIRHLYNTNAILNLEENPYEMARMGIGLYGISEPQSPDLEAVLKLKTKIAQIKQIKTGESVGYSRAFRADKEMKIGVLAIGYADGLFRTYSKEGDVFVHGQRVPIVGNICMDMTMIDLTNIPAQEGDEVELFGDHIAVTEIADKTGTIPYEIFTRISDRVKRVYVD